MSVKPTLEGARLCVTSQLVCPPRLPTRPGPAQGLRGTKEQAYFGIVGQPLVHQAVSGKAGDLTPRPSVVPASLPACPLSLTAPPRRSMECPLSLMTRSLTEGCTESPENSFYLRRQVVSSQHWGLSGSGQSLSGASSNPHPSSFNLPMAA